ncbi:hypothetical protein [Methylobacterium aquaticum]|uniref:hypothetical protein n=1 Tax=Methylobacterium aquaticum TaxID=270351 RepID=UPI001931B7C8|nr:hypothetical protein [Methylobacterium aquaticum]QRE78259.1 hypothetical protein F1D61_33070 [Methylobacterium aquaticum]
MLKTLKSLIGVVRAPDAPSSELESALASAEAQVTAAAGEVSEAEAAYQAGLLDSDDAGLARLRSAREAASVKQERAAALVTALRQRIAAVQVQEDEAGRRERYAAAKRASAAAGKVLATEYPRLARDLVAVLRQVAEADLLVIAANEALPAGAERLFPTEALVRREPDTPERVLKDEIFTAWCGPAAIGWTPRLRLRSNRTRTAPPASGASSDSRR